MLTLFSANGADGCAIGHRNRQTNELLAIICTLRCISECQANMVILYLLFIPVEDKQQQHGTVQRRCNNL